MKNKIIMLIMCMFLLVGTISAADFDNFKFNEDKTFEGKSIYGNELLEEYNPIKIKNRFGLGKILFEGYLSEHTAYCGEDCYSTIEINLNEPGVLVEDIKFKILQEDDSWMEQSIRSYQLYIIDDENKIPYNIGEEVEEGIYTLKLEGQKKPSSTVDWIIETNGEWLDDWAEWTSNLNEGLISYYKFDEEAGASGIIIDSLGRYNGTNDGADNITGKIKYAYDFVPSNTDGIDFTANPIKSSGGNISFGFWIYVNNSDTLSFLNFGDHSDDNHTAIGLKSIGSQIYAYSYDKSNNFVYDFPTSVSLNTWTFLVFTYTNNGTGTNVSIWKNGVYATSDFLEDIMGDMTSDFTLGRNLDDDQWFDGIIDEFFIYNISLDSSKISDLYNSNSGITYLQKEVTVDLHSPADSSTSTSNLVTFNCSAEVTGGETLTNMSLWTNESGGWSQKNITNLIKNSTTRVNLEAYYALEEESSPIIDREGGNDATNYGASRTDGKIDYGYYFGGDDYMNTTLAFPSDTWSVGFWIYQTSQRDYDAILSVNNLDLWIGVGSGGDMRVHTGISNYIDWSSVLSTGSWHYVVVSWNGSSDLNLYVDNVQKEPALTTGTMQDTIGGNILQIGKRNDAGFPNYLIGKLDEISIYDKVLNVTERTNNFNSGIGVTYPLYSKTQTWNRTITDTTLWTCQACNSDGNCSFAKENRTLGLDAETPIVTISSPIGGYDYGLNGESIDLNWTVTDSNLGSCWYNYNGTNYTVTCGDNHTTFNLEEGNYNLTFYSNDTLGNLNVTEVGWSYNIFGNSESYNISTYETASEYFIINVTANSSLTAASLIYNGVSHSSTKLGNVFTTSAFDIPASEGNKTFYWKFIYGGSYINSTLQNQTVNPTLFGLCNATLTSPYINFTFKDEGSSANINASIDSSTWEYWLGSGTITKELLFSNNSVNDYYTFCLLDGNKTLHNTRSLQFSSEGYPQRKYDASSDLTNTTTSKVLYLLSSADGIYSLIQVVDQDGNAVSGAEVTAERQFEGIWTVVGQETTDDAGTITFWVNPDYDHRFTFVKDGCTGTTTTIRPTQTQYTQQLQCGVSDEIYVSQIEGLKYSRGPAEGIIQEGIKNFTYYLYSSKDNIINASFRVVNSSNEVVLNSTDSSCTSSGCILYFLYNVTNGADLKGKYYVDIGNGSFLLEGDAHWKEIDIPTSGKAGIRTFFSDIRFLFNEWGDEDHAADFNRLVVVFFIMCLGISALNYNFNIDTQNPGAFLLIMTGFIFFGSLIGGTTSQGLFYFNNLITSDTLSDSVKIVVNNYLLAFICGLITISYYINVNRRAQQ